MTDTIQGPEHQPRNGQYLRETRERLGWSQGVIAAALGLSLRAYQDMEAREDNIRTAYFLAVEFLALHRATFNGKPEQAGEFGAQTARRYVDLLDPQSPAERLRKVIRGHREQWGTSPGTIAVSADDLEALREEGALPAGASQFEGVELLEIDRATGFAVIS